ncbi:response regulator transcription factor [Micromonospora sp. DR5-3]|uniref:response regulator transcription factor n=1 Tax=unclassified Micromonospora TaxID=2617518 RepID=UPI0011D379D5|nr:MULTISPECIES: response regulator transcription factor [unclassified Micromonospora]MCW3816355.1 response regulator transcription factor [Micromonospora sp. DR5-3]TYC22768.1 response regulator transcription factor [Micromonospora sp. MP36]
MRVLVVEDETALAEVIRAGLVDEGLAVDVQHTGPGGLWAASENTYDVVVLDIMLPGLSGYEVCRQLRSRGVWTPVLMLTAKEGEYDQADALDLGADDYLTKPFSFVVLVARLRALVRRGAPARPVVLAAGDLTLDPARRLVARAGQPVRVTAREFALLEFLMRHRGDVVSKTQIIENVWDAHFDGDPNIVEVYIGYLRRKIDQPFGRSAIQTERGMGYRLASDGG